MLLLFSGLVVSDSVTPWTAAHQASPSFTFSWGLLRLMSTESVMHPTISSSVSPVSSCLQSFLALGSFPMTRHFVSVGQSIGASASVSVLPMNIQRLFPLGLIGFISLLSKGLSRVFSSMVLFEGIDSSVLNLCNCPALTSMHD